MTTAAPDPSSSVVVSNPQTGAHETIRWADLSAALAQGYSVPTDEEVAYEKRKASVDSTADTIAAGLESAVDWGIPFGKTLREEALGPEYIERSKAREEFHPVARGIGGALGMGAMLLGTMGVGTGAKGAAVAAETAPELAGLGTNIATGLTAEGLAAGIPAAAADGLIAGAKIATAGTAARIGQIGAETTSALDAAAETSGITGLTNHIAVNALRDFSAPARALSAVGQGIGGIGGIATEGALWGASAEAGQLTEQGQWDNPDLVAERLVHGLWTGALLGAGLGPAHVCLAGVAGDAGRVSAPRTPRVRESSLGRRRRRRRRRQRLDPADALGADAFLAKLQQLSLSVPARPRIARVRTRPHRRARRAVP